MIRGIAYVMGASLIFGICLSVAKKIMSDGLSSMSLIFWYYVISMMGNGTAAIRKDERLYVGWRNSAKLLLLGVVGTGLTSFFLSSSYTYMPVGVTTTVHFLYPTFTALGMVVFFGERFSPALMAAAILSLFGMCMIAGKQFDASFIGYAFALASAITYSAYLIIMEKCSFGRLSVSARLFWMSMGIVAVFGTTILFSGEVFLIIDLELIALLCMNGALMFLAYQLLIKGIAILGATKTAFMSMAEPVTSLIVGSLFYPEDRITSSNVIGIVLIFMAMTLVTFFRGRQK